MNFTLFRKCFAQIPSREPGASTVTLCVGAATVNAFGRGIPSLFADFGLMALTTFDTHRLCAAVALRVVDPLAAMALRGQPRSAGPFNRDEEVANRLQLKNLISVLWYLDKYQGQGLFGPV
jgi:hypothetical protein